MTFAEPHRRAEINKKKIPVERLLWVDLEMTGLDHQKDVILEIAAIVTDMQLNEIALFDPLVIHYNLKNHPMVPIVQEMHATSGLTDAVAKSTLSFSEAHARFKLFVKQVCVQSQTALAGSSIWQDRSFLHTYMPDILDFLHYRMLDVSSFKIAVNAWYPSAPFPSSPKKEAHRALSDIRGSLEELRFYKQSFFR